MAKKALKRQFITDTAGNRVGVILSLEEFALIEDILEQRIPPPDKAEKTVKLKQMEKAANDPLFMSDLRETMSAFAEADAEWEPPIQMMTGASCPLTTGEALI